MTGAESIGGSSTGSKGKNEKFGFFTFGVEDCGGRAVVGGGGANKGIAGSTILSSGGSVGGLTVGLVSGDAVGVGV